MLDRTDDDESEVATAARNLLKLRYQFWKIGFAQDTKNAAIKKMEPLAWLAVWLEYFRIEG
jgi:hypothetical protein